MASYNDLVNIPAFEKRKEEFIQDRWQVSFYCRDCQKNVEATRLDPNKYMYECPLCKGKSISIGTESSVKEVYSKRR
jgi:Zn finger protein HypA/HybF involved in hydrogenase expression